MKKQTKIILGAGILNGTLAVSTVITYLRNPEAVVNISGIFLVVCLCICGLVLMIDGTTD
jgi:hypothetical protein